MSVYLGPNIVRDNLIFCIDAGSNRSYNRRANQSTLINTNNWLPGSGGTTGYSANGLDSENERLYNTGPYGGQSIVWKTKPVDGGGDGGWNMTDFAIDKNKLYRSSVWVRRVGTSGSGTAYHGLQTNGTNSTIRLSDSTAETNPYWDYRSSGWYTQNQWYLLVGHIFPSTWTGTSAHPDSGIYTPSSGTTKLASNAGNITSDVKFPTNATTAMQRCYHYYSGDTASGLEFAYPRWDVVDGTEPTIGQLLFATPESMQSIGAANLLSPPYNQPTWSTAGGGSWSFNGNNQYFYYPNTTLLDSQAITVEVWIKTNATVQSGFWFEKGTVNTQYALFQEGTQIQWRMGGNGDAISYNWQGIANTTNWFNVTATYTSGSQVMYINGNQVATGSQVSTLATTTYGINVGRHSSGYYFNGNIAIVRAYSRVLTAAEAKQNFEANRLRFGI